MYNSILLLIPNKKVAKRRDMIARQEYSPPNFFSRDTDYEDRHNQDYIKAKDKELEEKEIERVLQMEGDLNYG